MDAEHKKTALRMIPYGLYVMTARSQDGAIAAATVNWVTQTSFEPPLIAVGVKADSAIYATAKESAAFALNMLGRDQQAVAFAFFKPARQDGDKINGEPYHLGTSGAPILAGTPASVECRLAEVLAQGDHHVMLGEVVDASVRKPIAGRPDDAVLEMRALGEKVFYGG